MSCRVWRSWKLERMREKMQYKILFRRAKMRFQTNQRHIDVNLMKANISVPFWNLLPYTVSDYNIFCVFFSKEFGIKIVIIPIECHCLCKTIDFPLMIIIGGTLLTIISLVLCGIFRLKLTLTQNHWIISLTSTFMTYKHSDVFWNLIQLLALE